MRHREEEIGKALVKAKLITPEALKGALELSKSGDKKLAQLLVQQGLVTDMQISQAMELYYRVPYVKLKEHPVDHHALSLIPHRVAWDHQALPLSVHDKQITVAMADPEDVMAVDYLQNLTGYKIRVVFSDPAAVREAIQHYYGKGRRTSAGAVFAQDAPQPIGPYRQAVFFNKLLFVSGQIGLDAYGKLPATIQEQTRQAIENLKAILEKGRSGLGMVLKTTIFMVRMEDFSTVNEIYSEYFKGSFPARSAVAVKELPRGALVEIEAIAYNE